jgi:hypothetical protein
MRRSQLSTRLALSLAAVLVIILIVVLIDVSYSKAAQDHPDRLPGSLPATTPVAQAGRLSSMPAATATPVRLQTGAPTLRPTQAPATRAPADPTPTVYVQPPAEDWKQWAVIPLTVSERMREVYRYGLANGTDPNAFTVLGDCQGDSETFLGAFKTNQQLVSGLPTELVETIAQFDGSFNRYNPAAKSGSSAGSLLWSEWNDNLEGKCAPGESPLDCELRVHRPSIVFVHLGTHFEVPDRNLRYLTIIIERILANGAVPVMVTKADKLEGDDEYVNRNIATLAELYELPLCNFWASVQDLPAGGLLPNGMHLTPEAHTVHRIGALETLDAVWRPLQ